METFIKAYNEDPIASVGLLVAISGIAVAIWVVHLTIIRTQRATTLLSLRDELQTILDDIELALLSISDDGPYSFDTVQLLSITYWKAKKRFKLICEKAVVVISPELIRHSFESIPRLEDEYKTFKIATMKGEIDAKSLNTFKVVLVETLLVTEKIIARDFLPWNNRELSNQLFQKREETIREIQAI